MKAGINQSEVNKFILVTSVTAIQVSIKPRRHLVQVTFSIATLPACNEAGLYYGSSRGAEEEPGFPSGGRGKPDAVVATVELRVVAGDEGGSQDPDRPRRRRHVQGPEGDDADAPLAPWLLSTQRRRQRSALCVTGSVILR